jgi:predicted dehydrogenase
MTIRFGLVGAGHWGACHAEAIRRTPEAELAAVAVSTPESARSGCEIPYPLARVDRPSPEG